MATTASKIMLGQRPESFKQTVTFPAHDGSQASIEVEYIYRTRTELGKWEQANQALQSEVVKAIADDEEFWSKLSERSVSAGAEQLMQVIKGWNLDEPFNLVNAQALCDAYPNATSAIFQRYRQAINEGRLGN